MKKLISKMTTVAAVVATSALMIGCGRGEGEEKDDGQGDAMLMTRAKLTSLMAVRLMVTVTRPSSNNNPQAAQGRLFLWSYFILRRP